MQNLHFTTFINAPVEKVWNTMLEDATYRQWTDAFHPDSYFKGSWEEGSEMQFLGPSENGGEPDGMFSRIAKNTPLEYLSIEHLGIVKNGQPDTESDEAKLWQSAHENYIFTAKDGGTQLDIELDTDDKYADMFSDMWPQALEKLKQLSEA